jgi:tetratricopeptide (TPR) repeat protein
VRSLSTFPAMMVLAGMLASSAAAFAEAPAANKAAADVLYEDGKRLLGEKKYEQALAKLLASQHLDPGLGTLLNIAYCYEHVGKTASAWATYNEAAGVANATDDKEGRADMATRAAKALEPKLARVTITVPAENRPVGLEVRRDGEVVDPATWDSALPIDPGAHVFAASAPGRAAWKASVEIPMGPVTVPVLIPLLPPAPSEAKPEAGTSNARRTAGIAVGGTGLASIAAGAVFGGVSIAKKNGLAADCQPGNPWMCNAAGVELHTQALAMANASDVALALGGAALVTGAALFFTAPKSGDGTAASAVHVAPVATAGIYGVLITGRW